MYTYLVHLCLFDKKNQCNLTDFKDEIDQAVINYNRIGLRATKNPKRITNIKVESEILEIELESNIKLNLPTKSLAGFSRCLLDVSDDFEKFASNGRLFKGVSCKEKNITKESLSINANEDIKDNEAIKMVIDIFLSCEELDSNEVKFKDEIKNILKEYMGYSNK